MSPISRYLVGRSMCAVTVDIQGPNCIGNLRLQKLVKFIVKVGVPVGEGVCFLE